MSIVVIGVSFVDVKGFPDNAYIPQGRNSGRVEIVHGGVGRNVADDIARIGLHPSFVSMIDESGEGQAVLRRLENHGVDTGHIITAPEGMGMWLAIFDQTGDIIGSISRRPALDELAAYIRENGDAIFADADSILIEIDMDKTVVDLVFDYAAKYHKPVYAVVANMSIASERRDLIRSTSCLVCNRQEAEMLFLKRFSEMGVDELSALLPVLLQRAHIPAMVVTLGGEGSVYANIGGEHGFCPAKKVKVRDTTGAGDAFFAGVAVGLTYGKSLAQSAVIGTRLAASVITSSENVCPRFRPEEFELGECALAAVR